MYVKGVSFEKLPLDVRFLSKIATLKTPEPKGYFFRKNFRVEIFKKETPFRAAIFERKPTLRGSFSKDTP